MTHQRSNTMTIRTFWKRFILPATFLGIAFMAYDLRAQAIYLNHDYGSVDAAKVDQAAWSIRQRTDMAMSIAGTTTTQCGQNLISVRYAGIAEWAAANAGSAYAFTANCANNQQMQVVWSPYVPMHVNGLRHELSHAAGCWQHLPFNTYNVMHPVGSAEFLTVSDTDCIINGAFWPLGTVDKCFVEVGATLGMYIPSVSGLQVWLGYQGMIGGQHTWTETRRVATGLSCPGNALSGSVVEFDDVRSYSLGYLTYVRIRNTVGTTWVLEAAR